MRYKLWLNPIKVIEGQASELEGWGNYLRKIDVLKDKVAQKKKLNLNDACSVLYLEGHCSYHWQHFKEDCIKTGATLPQNWEGWHQMFQNSLKYCEWAK